MKVKVRFRFNTVTGQVETFIDDQGSNLPVAEHNQQHDRIASEVGGIVARDPRVVEVLPGIGAAPDGKAVSEPAETEKSTETTPDEQRRRKAT